MEVELKDVDIENYSDILELRIESEQERFVPSSCYLIAKSKFHPNHQVRAIYAEGNVVGLVYIRPVTEISSLMSARYLVLW